MKGQSGVCVCLLAAASCARHERVATVIPLPAAPPPVKAVDAEERNDEAEAAAAFYLLKRARDGANLPVERYLGARAAARRMPLYSSARRSFVSTRGNSHTSLRDVFQQGQTGGWAPLGPGNIGGLPPPPRIYSFHSKFIFYGTPRGRRA